MAYLITGASGSVGSGLVTQLAGRGLEIRTLTRKPLPGAARQGVETFIGDLTTSTFPDGLLDGVQEVFLYPVEGSVDAFLKLAKSRGVRRVVLLSSLSVTEEHPQGQRSWAAKHHHDIEVAVQASGLAYTILRPTAFANNLRWWASTIRTQGKVFGPYPDSAQALIHEADIAAVAATVLTTPGHEGVAYPLTGPAAVSRRDQLAAIGLALGKELIFQAISPEQYRQSMRAHISEEIVEMHLEDWSKTEKTPEVVHRTVERLTGRPARSARQWALDHVKDFL